MSTMEPQVGLRCRCEWKDLLGTPIGKRKSFPSTEQRRFGGNILRLSTLCPREVSSFRMYVYIGFS